MGQGQSSPTPPPRRVLTKSQTLFLSLSKGLPHLTLQDYNAIFAFRAETDGPETSIKYWTEDTLETFLDVPVQISSLLYKSVTYLAALPTVENAPAPLDREGLGLAVMFLTQRIPKETVPTKDLNRLIFNSFAERPPELNDPTKKANEDGKAPTWTIGTQIHTSSMLDLVQFLLSISTSEPLVTPESVAAATNPSNRQFLTQIGNSIISAMKSYAKSPSDRIHYDAFSAFIERDAPYFFDPLVPLFQKFLFDQQKWGNQPMSAREDWVGPLQAEHFTSVMNQPTLAQISLFFPKELRMAKLVTLYAGSRDGFSMGMFESKVLKYPGPTILILCGTVETENNREAVIFGAYISTPWKSSTKDNFGDKSSFLFQLLPTHSVYHSAPYHTQFVYFNPRIGLGFGVPPPQLPRRQSVTPQTLIHHTSDPQVSLSVDPSLEHATFTHIPPGGTFQSHQTQGELSYKIEVGEVEVWGCGLENAREEQRRAWEFERNEAERRQSVRVREDLSGDKAILEMAGIIGGNRSGGSV